MPTFDEMWAELKSQDEEFYGKAEKVADLLMELGKLGVDAVEVVRCKDCKWSRERNENERNYLVEGVLICTSGEATDCCWNPVWSNHFCSCGMRGDNDA